MDTSSTPSNSARLEAPTGVRPEDLQVGAAEQVRPGEGAPAGGEAAPEAAPAAAETAPAPGTGSMPPAPSAAPPPTLTAADVAAAIAAVPTPVAPNASVVSTPAAADVDVIEPEWVAKAEDVVRAHQGDPYGEEEAIEDLQQDYLLKRYGHKVADPDAGNSRKGA